mmetsp:Transcript_13063/g.14687  ORF Transcript_13063/g.14687 Transcript_13063/m.14687 type:complete len:136 (-) Transcript_13063:93-500(-)
MVVKKNKGKNSKGRKRDKGYSKRELDEDSYYVSGISDGAIKRLARRGGIKRVSAGIYPEVRLIYLNFIDKLAEDSFNYAECARRRTIHPIDVVYALKRQGRNIYGYVYDDDVGGHNAIKHDDDKGSNDESGSNDD